MGWKILFLQHLWKRSVELDEGHIFGGGNDLLTSKQ